METEDRGDELELDLEFEEIEDTEESLEIDLDDDFIFEAEEDDFEESDDLIELELDFEDEKDEAGKELVQVVPKESLQVRKDKSLKAMSSINSENGKATDLIKQSVERSVMMTNEKAYMKGTTDLIKEYSSSFPVELLSHLVKEVNRIDDSSVESLKDSLKNLGYSSKDVDNVYSLLEMDKFIKKVKRASNMNRFNEFTQRDTNFSNQFTGALLSLLRDNILTNSPKLNEYETDLVTHLRFTPSKVYYTCPRCKKEYELDSPLISFVYTSNGLNRVCSYMVCDDCKIFITLSLKDLNSITRFVNNINSSGSTFRDYKGLDLMGCEFYKPGNLDLAEILKDIATFDEEGSVTFEEAVYVDWNVLSNNFMKMQEVFYKDKRHSSSDKIGVSGVAKILAEQSNDYLDLKQRALATLIGELRSLNLYEVSNFYYNLNKIPLCYAGKIDEYSDGLLNLIPSSVKPSELHTPQGLQEFRNDFNKYCDDEKFSDERRNRVIDELSKWKVSLSNLPISSSLSLTDEDYQDYLSYEPLRLVLDEITDYMIVNSVAESYFEYFIPRKYDTNENKNKLDASYNIRKKRALEASTHDELREKICKFTEFFQRLDGYEEFLLSYVSSSEFLDRISSYCDNLLQYDFYSASREREIIISKFGFVVDELSGFNRYSMVNEIVKGFIPVDLDVSEFDFYFADVIGCDGLTDTQKEVLLDARKRKLLVPKELKGNSFEEKLDYYENLESLSEMKLPNIQNHLDFVSNNKIAIKALSLINRRLEFNDSRSYFMGRDLFLMLSDNSVSDFSKMMGLNKDICKCYLDLNYEYLNVEFDYSRLIKYVPFDDSNLRTLINDSFISEREFESQMLNYNDYLLGEIDNGELINRIITSFLDKTKGDD